jgi:hypothetical protein
MHAVNTTQQESWVLKAPLLHVYELHLCKGHVLSPEPMHEQSQAHAVFQTMYHHQLVSSTLDKETDKFWLPSPLSSMVTHRAQTQLSPALPSRTHAAVSGGCHCCRGPPARLLPRPPGSSPCSRALPPGCTAALRHARPGMLAAECVCCSPPACTGNLCMCLCMFPLSVHSVPLDVTQGDDNMRSSPGRTACVPSAERPQGG